jgi:hypothetical protein
MTARILWLTFAALATLAYGLPGAVVALSPGRTSSSTYERG